MEYALMCHQWLLLDFVPVDGWQHNHLLQMQEETASGKLEEQLKGDTQWPLKPMAAAYGGHSRRGQTQGLPYCMILVCCCLQCHQEKKKSKFFQPL